MLSYDDTLSSVRQLMLRSPECNIQFTNPMIYFSEALTLISVRCTMYNSVFFRTYDAVEFRPGPYLNVIIGPNATGKSSVVCAICLGLGGKTAFLGRAKDPSDYIKHGQQQAFIEIEL